MLNYVLRIVYAQAGDCHRHGTLLGWLGWQGKWRPEKRAVGVYLAPALFALLQW